ncbi:hypothetical protein GCM10010413_25880 [Promicromonospora sukumoe]|uniref:ACT domain-containing protein n=1 Tax=Promicromonospora sukumoe TaxID=88382 RepID=A0A7W3PE57_9MICO|nr:ACT domain-containing protein [Promicromonospora sukumoe]MBA8808197.1 hypothetical protein [Promicromonospora sukumoe]
MSTHPQDLEVHLPDRPGELAGLGQALGEAGVSLEGGGVVTVGGRAVAHYLVHDGARALAAVTAAGIGPAVVHDVVLARLDQEVPGQLGTLARRLGDAGVNVLVQYSDHVGNLVLLVADEDLAECRKVVAAWSRRRPPAPGLGEQLSFET